MTLKKDQFDKNLVYTNNEGRQVLARVVYDYKYLVDYHPYRKGNNPLFDDNSDKILRFKEGTQEAIEYFGNMIDQDFDSIWNDCYCVAVPSHDPTNNYKTPQDLSGQNLSPVQILIMSLQSKNSAVYELIDRLAKKHKGLHNGSAVLIRTHEVAKKSFGGNRDISVDLGSIEINGNCGIDISGKNVLLIDDVITTGNSIAACKMILKKGGAKNVFVLCLAKTSRDPYVSTDTSADVPFDEEVPF